MNGIKKIIYERAIPLVGKFLSGRNRFVNVIYYHDIVEGEGHSYMKVNIDTFRRQMEMIASSGFKTLRFDDLSGNAANTGNTVLIAFDDGWKSNGEMIYNLMKNLGLKYNVFLTMGKIGVDPDYLTWDDVRSMHADGIVGFGAHTYTHPDMSDLSKVDTDVEIVEADSLFERELGFIPKDFCYPFGYYSEETNTCLLENTPYERIYTSKMMYSYQSGGKIVFGRNGISQNDSMRVFEGKLKGYYNCWSLLTER